MSSKTTIELNGKRYDALTGKMVGEFAKAAVRPVAAAPKPISAASVSGGKNMDGFFRGASTPQAAPAKKARPTRNHQPVQAKRKPERSKTLMRHVVPKPKPNIAPARVKAVSAPSSTKSTRAPKIIAAPSLLGFNQRIEHAKHVVKSPLIHRFNDIRGHYGIEKIIAPLKVKQAPTKIITTPIDPARTPALPLPAPMTHKRDIFSDALTHADSHKRANLKTRNRVHHKLAKRMGVSSKILSGGAASLAALLIAGFVAYQNVPNFAIHIASAKAGFNATMPGYKPAGFTLNGSIQSSPGVVTVKFHSNTDNRSFAVTQKPSSWTSESLLSNFVATNNQPYQAYQDKGRTIYIYGGSNATWVNGGVWYQIEGDSSLNSTQLISLANSI